MVPMLRTYPRATPAASRHEKSYGSRPEPHSLSLRLRFGLWSSRLPSRPLFQRSKTKAMPTATISGATALINRYFTVGLSGSEEGPIVLISDASGASKRLSPCVRQDIQRYRSAYARDPRGPRGCGMPVTTNGDTLRPHAMLEVMAMKAETWLARCAAELQHLYLTDPRCGVDIPTDEWGMETAGELIGAERYRGLDPVQAARSFWRTNE